MIINHHYRFVFVHIPKTAGTSLAEQLIRLKGNDRGVEKMGTRHVTYRDAVQKISTGILEREGFSQNYLTLAFTRNPWERFYSLHTFLLEKAKHIYPNVPKDVNEFANAVGENATWTQSIRSLRTQYSFVEGVEGPMYLGRFECFDDDVGRVSRLFSKRLRVKRLNVSKCKSPDFRRVFSKSTEKLIEEKYGVDIEFFGYRRHHNI